MQQNPAFWFSESWGLAGGRERGSLSVAGGSLVQARGEVCLMGQAKRSLCSAKATGKPSSSSSILSYPCLVSTLFIYT